MVLSNRCGVEGEDMNNIITELDTLRLEHQETIQQLIRDNDAHEAHLIKQIRLKRATSARREYRSNNSEILFVIGENLRITNRLRNKQGITGGVISSGLCMVMIGNTRTRNIHTRA